MRSFKANLLAGAAALLAAAGLCTPASAATITGGGSSLIAPYWSQALGCYVVTPSTQVEYYVPNPAVPATPNNILATPTACPASPANIQNVNSSDIYKYVSASSGKGIAAFYSEGDTPFGTFPTTHPLNPIAYGASDSALASGDLSVYTSGGTIQGVTIPSSGTGNPFHDHGALVQIPIAIDPVTIAYNPGVFNIATADGHINLDRAAYCGIFNQTITDWNDSHLTDLNSPDGNPANGVSLTGGVSASITLVGRADSSGTTSIFQRHLANVCSGTNHYVDGNSTLPSGVTFTTATGSGGVANAIAANALAIGYIGPDYVQPFNATTGATLQNLEAASLFNANNSQLYTPTPANALTAFGSILPPQSNANGSYNASAPGSRSNQLDWVPGTAATDIEDPSSGYPILGTTNGLFYTSYTGSGQANALVAVGGGGTPEGLLHWYYNTGNDVVNDPVNGILAQAGLAPVPDAWKRAINDTFVTNAAGLGLNIH